MQSDITYSDLIVEALARYPHREAFVAGDRRITYGQAANLIAQFAATFNQCGVGAGDSVALLSGNAPECWFAQAATCLLGGRFTGLQAAAGASDQAEICADAETTVLVAAEAFEERAQEIISRCETVEHLVIIPAQGGVGGFDPAARNGLPALEPGPAGAEDPAWVQYTGGTSGRPKGVMVPHRALVQQTLSHLASWGIPEQPRYLAAGPISHAAALPVLPTLMRGGTIVLMPAFDPDQWLHLVQREAINLSFVVPTMLYSILDQAKPEAFDVSSLQTVVYGAAPTSPARLIEAIERIGPVFQQAYGQTEVVGVGTALRRDEHDPARPELLTSCGRPVVGARLAVLGEAGSFLPHDQVGELCLRTRATMLGYRNRPEETAETLRDGWVHTGDMARLDERGFVHLVDRKKDMIISGGYNIYSREIEDVLHEHPAVAGAAVIGIPHEKWGEAVSAVVVRRPDRDASAEELIDFVRGRKGSIYAPKSVTFTGQLPTTTTGKVDKKLLREPYWNDRDRAIN